MIDYTKLLKKLSPEPEIGGDPGVRMRTATVAAIASDGTVDLTMADGATVPDVPVLGGASFVVGTVVQVISYRGSMLVLGGSGGASSQAVQATGTAANSGSTTGSTAYVNTLTGTGIAGGVHGVAFIAPPSGRVMVHGRAVAGNGTVATYVLLDFEVRAGSVVGSGAVFRAANDDTAGAHQSATAGSQSNLVSGTLVTGLTPGAVYNAALAYRITNSSSTGFYNRRYIAVLPQ